MFRFMNEIFLWVCACFASHATYTHIIYDTCAMQYKFTPLILPHEVLLIGMRTSVLQELAHVNPNKITQREAWGYGVCCHTVNTYKSPPL